MLLLTGAWIRTGAVAATLHLFGTFAIVVSSPRLLFQPWFPLLTIEGEFLVKNLVLLSAAAALWSLSPRSTNRTALSRARRVAAVTMRAVLTATSAGLAIYLHQGLRAVAERSGRPDWRDSAEMPVPAPRIAAAPQVTLNGVISARCPLLGCWIKLRDAQRRQSFIDLAPTGLSARHLRVGSPIVIEAEIGKTRDGEVGLVASRLYLQDVRTP